MNLMLTTRNTALVVSRNQRLRSGFPRVLNSPMSQQTKCIELPKIELIPCNIQNELTPEEIAIMKEDLASGITYKIDEDAWKKAGQPLDTHPFLRLYRHGVLTDEPVQFDLDDMDEDI
eukprot:TRINITY_DN28237_c0_g1_i1.p1 TRINITY_DN28237_c0_g1~~TRINITY_DN28237_c0_g1_i1.p1  ORF type:complete len:118 (+),score=21.44 TRINITY_DN28237_c0_g1_i1:1-354(+)